GLRALPPHLRPTGRTRRDGSRARHPVVGTVSRIRSPRTRFLPKDPRVQSPYRMTPQIALRLGVLGALVLFAFAVLFFRLWALQVLSGERYLAAAQNNQLRTIRIEAPRGPIYDDRGRTFVGNNLSTGGRA